MAVEKALERVKKTTQTDLNFVNETNFSKSLNGIEKDFRLKRDSSQTKYYVQYLVVFVKTIWNNRGPWTSIWTLFLYCSWVKMSAKTYYILWTCVQNKQINIQTSYKFRIKTWTTMWESYSHRLAVKHRPQNYSIA